MLTVEEQQKEWLHGSAVKWKVFSKLTGDKEKFGRELRDFANTYRHSSERDKRETWKDVECLQNQRANPIVGLLDNFNARVGNETVEVRVGMKGKEK